MKKQSLSLFLAITVAFSVLSVFAIPVNAVTPASDASYQNESLNDTLITDATTISRNVLSSETDSQTSDSDLPELIYTCTKDNGDGTKTLELYGYPVSYRTKDGEIKDISLELKREGKGFRSGEHFVNTEFPEKIGEGITLKTGNLNIKITPVEKNNVTR